MAEPKTAQTHIYRLEPESAGEAAILQAYTRPGMRVLDIGCAATGRSARLLQQLGCEVTTFDINEQAVREFMGRPDSAELDLAAADMCALPFQAGSFELVLCALHGLDYLLTDQLRARAFSEISRVLGKEGVFVFNSLNPIGLMLSPGGFFSKKILRLRLQKMMRLDFLKPTTIDMNGIELYQALPQKVIKQVKQTERFQLRQATNFKGSTDNLLLLTLFSTGPYFVFSRV